MRSCPIVWPAMSLIINIMFVSGNVNVSTVKIVNYTVVTYTSGIEHAC